MPYVQEALRWLPPDRAERCAARRRAMRRCRRLDARVLVADDNADMREYMTRLLADRWSVDAVADGATALAAAQAKRPDVIVADVMMPGLDGFGLLPRAPRRSRDSHGAGRAGVGARGRGGAHRGS